MKILLSFLLAVLAFNLNAQKPAARIVSLAPSLTKSIYYMGAAEQLVGRTSYCFIADADDKEVVASAVSVNIEKVLTLKPDLVLATGITNPETIALLQRAGIRTKVFQTPRNFEEICLHFQELGRLTGREAAADSIVAHTRQEVEQIKASYEGQAAKTFFFQIGANPLFTVLDHTFMNDYINFSGGINVAGGLKAGTLSREWVLMKNPEVIVIVNMGLVGEEEKAIWESYPQLRAVKNDLVFFVESDMASTPNPPDFLKTLQSMQKILQAR